MCYSHIIRPLQINTTCYCRKLFLCARWLEGWRVLFCLRIQPHFPFFMSFFLQLGFPGQRWRMSAHKGSQGAYERVCVSPCVWERHIKLNWRTHRPLASRACDNHDIKSENSMIHTHNRAHRGCHTGSISCSQGSFWCCCRSSCCSSCCCLCCCFGVRSVSEKELSNLHKMSMIDHCILPSYPVTLSAWRKSKHFAFKILKYGEQCREVNWHLFGLFVCLVTLPNSHQATRQQRSDFSYTSEVKQRYNTACQNDTQVSCNDYIVFTASLSTLLLSSRQTHHRKLAAHRSLCALRT